MKHFLKFIYKLFFQNIFNFRYLTILLTNYRWFLNGYKKIKIQKGDDKKFDISSLYPILTDRNEEGGTMTGHYFHQDLHVARLIHQSNPSTHLDIGSRTDGFVAHVASFRQIEIIDIRDIKSKVKNISFRKADLMQLPNDLLNYCDSISSLHAIEHFGLGRYGDPIDYYGHLKAIQNITKILKTGGSFYFSVPIGLQRIEFNAHRVFTLSYLIEIITNEYEVNSFSYVDDNGNFFENVDMNPENIKGNYGCIYGCGIFHLIKK
jgi:SAM-dependent methyltransferase